MRLPVVESAHREALVAGVDQVLRELDEQAEPSDARDDAVELLALTALDERDLLPGQQLTLGRLRVAFELRRRLGDDVRIAVRRERCRTPAPGAQQSMHDEIEGLVKQELGRPPVRVEGRAEQQWVLIDYGDVIVHVFHEDQREFYEIERLYLDVDKIEWQLPADSVARDEPA